MSLNKYYACIVLVLLCIFEIEYTTAQIVSVEDYREVGTYTRKWLFVIPLYDVTLYTLDFDRIKARVDEMELELETPGFTDDVSNILLDSTEGFDLLLSYKPLLSMKNFAIEKEIMRSALSRAGFPVDKNWNLQTNETHQNDVLLYVSHILGLEENNPGDYYEYRKRGDKYLLHLSSKGMASVSYEPSSSNKNGNYGSFRMTSPVVLKGIIMTYLSYSMCSEELREELPVSLLTGLLDSN
ncbi:MAG: hypothetical protein RIF33_15310 [Cyclobacteriaceae bacterium]